MQKWLNIGVSGQVGWPKKRCEVDFGENRLLLLPRTKTTLASVHIEVSKMDLVEAQTTINRFLSIMSWCECQPLVNHGGWSGNPVPVPVPLPRVWISHADYFAFARQPLPDPKQRLAVALYREAKNLNSIPYQFLSYFKVLNIFWNDKKKNGKNELVEALRTLLQDVTDGKGLERLRVIQEHNPDPARYLYKSGRCAIAHAFSEPLVDPDDVADVRRLSEDMDLIRSLAEHLIKSKLGISRCLWSDATS